MWIGLGVLGLAGWFAGGRFGRVFGTINGIRFGHLYGGFFGTLAGAFIGAVIGVMVVGALGTIPGAMLGSLVGTFLASKKWEPIGRNSWAALGACIGGLVLATWTDREQAFTGALIGAGTGGLLAALVVMLMLVTLGLASRGVAVKSPLAAWQSGCAKPQAAAPLYLRHHVDPSPLAVEGDDAVGESEERVVLAAADVPAGVVARAALPDDDGASGHDAAAINLDAQALAVGVTTVAAGALTFLMSHRCLTFAGGERSLSFPSTISTAGENDQSKGTAAAHFRPGMSSVVPRYTHVAGGWN